MRNINSTLFLLLLLISASIVSMPNIRYMVCKTFPAGSGCEATVPPCGYAWCDDDRGPCYKYNYWGRCGKDGNGKEKEYG